MRSPLAQRASAVAIQKPRKRTCKELLVQTRGIGKRCLHLACHGVLMNAFTGLVPCPFLVAARSISISMLDIQVADTHPSYSSWLEGTCESSPKVPRLVRCS
jgi:hypothetical protein